MYTNTGASDSILLALQYGDESDIRQVAWSPDGRLVAGRSAARATTKQYGTILLWDAISGQCTATLRMVSDLGLFCLSGPTQGAKWRVRCDAFPPYSWQARASWLAQGSLQSCVCSPVAQPPESRCTVAVGKACLRP